MTRVLIPIILFLLPFALYGLAVALSRSTAPAAGTPPNRSAHYVLLGLAGLIMAGASIGAFAIFATKHDYRAYVPPTVNEQGQLTPGYLADDANESGG